MQQKKSYVHQLDLLTTLLWTLSQAIKNQSVKQKVGVCGGRGGMWKSMNRRVSDVDERHCGESACNAILFSYSQSKLSVKDCV